MKRRGMSFQVAAGPAGDDLSSRGGVKWVETRPHFCQMEYPRPR